MAMVLNTAFLNICLSTIDEIDVRLFNGADENLIQNTLRCIGGMNHAW